MVNIFHKYIFFLDEKEQIQIKVEVILETVVVGTGFVVINTVLVNKEQAVPPASEELTV